MKNTLTLCLVIGLSGCHTATQEPAGSALPRFKNDASSQSSCGDDELAHDTEILVSFPAWVTASESIFVGTIKSVHHVSEGQVRLYCFSEDGSFTRTIVDGFESCPRPDLISRAIEIQFDDVETLHGAPLGETFSIQMGPVSASDYPGISFRDGDPFPIDHLGNRVYMPGARIGATVVTDGYGIKRWNYRQFEVIDGNVRLGEFDPSARECRTSPIELGIPDEYEGVPLEVLKADMQNIRALTDLENYEVERHHGWVSTQSVVGVGTLSSCRCDDDKPVDSQDPSIPNDPDFQG